MLIPRLSLLRFAHPLAGAAFLLATAIASLAQNTWDDRSSFFGTSSNLNVGVAHNGSRFLMVTSSAAGTYWKSAAGTSDWSFDSLPERPTAYSAKGIAFGNGVTVVTGVKNTLHTTSAANPAGADWTKLNPITRPNGSVPDLSRPRFLNGQFVVGAPFYNDLATPANSYSEFLTSPDGATWTSRKFSLAALTNIFHLRDVAFKAGASAGGGTYVFVTQNNTLLTAPESFASANRVTISSISSGQAITYGAGLFVLLADSGKIFTSPNGALPWTERSLPAGVATSELRDVFFDGTTFVAVGATVTGSSPARPTILLSTDGITWTEAATVPSSSQPLSFAYKGDGLWLAGGNIRTLFTSGQSSVAAPSFTAQPADFFGAVGGTITLTATATGGPAPTLQWYKGDTALADDARISGSATATLTITGATFADAGAYKLKATNTVGNKNSDPALVTLSASADGAVFAPFGLGGSDAGGLIPGAAPAQAVVRSGGPALFTVGAGIDPLTGTSIGGADYSIAIAASPSGNLILLNATSGAHPPAVYDVATSQIAVLPALSLPLGSITSVNSIGGVAIADNGDIAGSINDQGFNLHAFHYSAATQTYTLLGNVPNTANDRATSAGGISADGDTISGYERIGPFNGPFLWHTTNGFTLLPDPANGGFANGDIRAISPNARFVVGYGLAPASIGSGSTAFRWDRGESLGTPVGTALPTAPGSTFADARAVTDDGTVGGNVRLSGVEHAAVWLPDGTLVLLADYLAQTYGLELTGFTLHQVVAISDDGRTLAGYATNSAGATEGWILTLPAPIEVAAVETTPQSITFDALGNRVAGSKSFTLSASASSKLPVSFSLSTEPAEGVATLSGSVVSIGSIAGTVTIRASQDGGEKGGVIYAPAEPVDRSFEVTLGPPTQSQTITFAPPAKVTYGVASFDLVATASSELPVTLELVSGPGMLDGSELTVSGAGKIVVRATQPGAYPFKAATAVTRTITVEKAVLTVTIADATRAVGQPNPVFDLNYEGFIGSDSVSAISTPPAAVTKAGSKSAPGVYDVTIKGGVSADYAFALGEPGRLAVLGFGGAYEALLVDGESTPLGKVELTLPANSLTYSGTLTLANEARKTIALKGAFVPNGDFSAAATTFTRDTEGVAALSLALTVSADGALAGSLERNGEPFADLDAGRLLFVPAKGQRAPWAGAHTAALRPPAVLFAENEGPIPAGSGYATATIDAKGNLKLSGKLADGATLTASLKPASGEAPADGASYRVFINPYNKRLDSFLAGRLALAPHAEPSRFTTPRFQISADSGAFLVWQKAESPAKPVDAAYRSGFGPLMVPVVLDPWLPPSAKTTAALPAGSLPQRLGLAADALSSATLAVGVGPADLDLGDRTDLLPTLLTLGAKGLVTVAEPVTTPVNVTKFSLKITASTGAFSGNFTLSDQVNPPPAKASDRKVSFFGTLRQAPDGESDLGAGFFLVDPTVDDGSGEQISAELTLSSALSLP